MPPRSNSDRSPVSVTRWTDECESIEIKAKTKEPLPLTKSLTWSTELQEVFPIPHLNDMSDEEVESVWYSGKEYAEIKASYQLTIIKMEAGEKLDGETHTSRGLEYRTQEGAWARYENKRDAYNAVLDEQDRQWKIDIDDQDTISRIYLDHSRKCAAAALARGLQDLQDIQEYLTQSGLKKLMKKKKKKSISEKSEKSSEKTSKTKKASRRSSESSDEKSQTERSCLRSSGKASISREKRDAV